jgi:hypothetical protein
MRALFSGGSDGGDAKFDTSKRKGCLGCIALICATLLGLTAPAAAFDAPSRIEQKISLNSQCELKAFVANLDGGLASVRVNGLGANPSTLTQAAGGVSHFQGGLSNAFPRITTANLEGNCGLMDVTGFVQEGATGPYATDDYIGVSFEATHTSDGSRYAYLAEIGGQSATQVTVTRTLVNEAPTATLGSPSGPDSDGRYSVIATLSENSTDFTVASLTLTNTIATVSGSGSSYTVLLSPLADGPVTVSVPKGGFTDSGGLGNWVASNEVAFSADVTAPTITIGALSGPTAGVYTAAITLSEASTDFAADDLTLANATATLSGSGTSYTATLTPLTDGQITLSVAAGRFTDAAGNDNTASNEVTADFDGTPPTATLGALSGPVAGVYTSTLTFSEAVTGLSAAELTVVNATATLSGSGASYAVELTPQADGALSVTVPADVAEDAAGNGNTASATQSATFDGTAPTITIGALSGPTAGVYTAAITLSEASTNFTVADLTLVNATATLSGSGTSYTATLTPAGDGQITLSVAAGRFTDAAGNDNTASNEVTADFDGTPPTATLGALSGPVAGVYTSTLTFSEAVTGLSAAELTVVNATATLSGSGASYVVELTPQADGALSVTVPADVAEDAAGNGNTASATQSATFDGTPPTITIGALSGPAAGVYTAAITLSEASTDFAADDLTLANATATLSGSGTNYIATLTPAADGQITLSVAAGRFTDAAGNDNTASNEVTADFDGTPPTATLGALSGPVAGVYTSTLTFSEAVTGLSAAELTVVNATATLSGSGASYVVELTPQADGALSVTVPADVAEDAAGNGNTASATQSATFDGTPPTITIGALSGPTAGVYTAAITLSEASTDFAEDDLTLANATATLSGSGTSYTATLTPAGDGQITLSVAAGRFTDAASNDNTASNEVTAIFDGTAPTVSITGAPSKVNAMSSFTVTITFSENVTGFDSGDIIATHATVDTVTGSDAVYQARLTASGSGAVSLAVPADAAVDAASNGNIASNSVSIADFTVEETQELIASFMQTRANQLISNQPGLTGFLSGQAQGGFNVNVSRGQGQFNFASNPDYPVWMQARGAWSSNTSSKSRYMFGALGSHRKVNENLLIGAMVQFDHLSEDTGMASVDGTGWMVGPYFVAKSAGQPLYFEGRLLYGETSNTISPFGTYEDDFDTTRLLAQFKVTGAYVYGSAATLYPFLDASYVTDDQHSYVDSLGNVIPEQGIGLGQIEIGLDFKLDLPVASGELELVGGVSGIWSRTSGSGFASTVSPDYEGARARIELGVNRVLSSTRRFNAATFYDGIGASGFESFGVNLGYEMLF